MEEELPTCTGLSTKTKPQPEVPCLLPHDAYLKTRLKVRVEDALGFRVQGLGFRV